MSITARQSLAPGTVVYDSIPNPIPPNVVSQPFQAQQTLEFGDLVQLESDTPRRLGYTTLLMSNWALASDYPALPDAGFSHPITLNIYADVASATAGTPIATVTQSFVIPWRPAADPTCPNGGTAWRAANGNCYNGLATPITFDLRSLNFDLPETFVYGIAYNTQSYGKNPIGQPGPYNSLNVGLHSTPPVPVGVDVNPNAVVWNTLTAAWYTDSGTGGVGTFREDTNWAPYTPAIQFNTFAVPVTIESCKYGAWLNLVRTDFSRFGNQGDCVSYVKTGK